MFDNTREIILIEYEKVLRNSDQLILYKLVNELYDEFSDVLEMEDIKGMDMDNCLRLCSTSTHYNILEAIAKYDDIDWKQAHLDFFVKYPDIYKVTDKLIMFDHLAKLSTQKFVDKIYIYSRFGDKRVYDDIEENLYTRSINAEFVYGDLRQLINEGVITPPTSFIMGDIEMVPIIKEVQDKLKDYTEIMVAGYRFNKEYVPVEEEFGGGEKLVFKQGEKYEVPFPKFKPLSDFTPVALREGNFTQF